MSITTGTFPGVRIADMPDLGAVTDSSSFVAERAGSGRMTAPNLRSYITSHDGEVNVMDWGAKGDGVTNDDAAILAAYNSARAGNLGLYFPATPNSYRVTNPLAITGPMRIRGVRNCSMIKSTSPTSDIFVLAGEGITIRELSFDCTGASTAGAYISMPGVVYDIKILDCYFQNHSRAIRTMQQASALVDIANCYFYNTVSSIGACIEVGGSDGGIIIRNCTMNSGAIPQPLAGVYISSTGCCVIDNCNIIQHGHCLCLAPPTGKVIASLYAANTFFDTSDQNGLTVVPSGGSVVRCRFIGCWFSSHTYDGVNVSGTGTVTGLEFIDCHAFNNGSDGFDFAFGSGFTLIGCQAAGNNFGGGITIEPGISGFTISGCTCGPCGGYGGNNYGVIVEGGASDHYIIVNNQLQGNTTNQLSDSGTGTHKIVSPNLVT